MKTRGDGSKTKARKLAQRVPAPSLCVALSCSGAVYSEIPGIPVIPVISSCLLFLLPL